ncbi:S1C family serine protease [Magnetospirillum sp. UT-4]|uniref:S1C family serine protease n=1 Tax=Magnetospirillum sp. UT-4 TaxID=2681467 RepID=UPI001572A67B|nr:trypsin-like peptidase domain-containing protein [Magnetospirillum sp. UT-4]
MTVLVAAVALLWAAAVPAAADEGDLPALLAAARAAGEASPDIAKVTLVEATSRQLLRIEGDIDFPFSVGIDLPLDAQPRDISAALSASVEDTGRFVVIFDVALAKVSRKVRDMKDKASRRIVGVNKTDNPAYMRAIKQLDSASAKLERAPGHAKLVKMAEDAQQKLVTTPRYIEQPVYGNYAYKLAHVEGAKALTVNYFVVDRVKKRSVKGVFDVVEREQFTLAYDMDPTDPEQSMVRGDVASERQLRDWERAAVVIPLSQVLDQAAAAPSQPLVALEELLRQVARDRTSASLRANAETYDNRPLNDPRFDSVVVVYTPGSLGTGFFVRSNIVMTNWHVVESRPIVEMRFYDRRETFGQVIAKDVRLDLALVKVQDRGRPVEFFEGKGLMPGDRVDAIGHPQSRLFSITRGVVSAIRKAEGSNVAQRQRARPVLFIQTDANINPGNSGGPLFKGDKVVGINSWGQQRESMGEGGVVMVPAPGLNFALHYSEAKRFLDESLRGE